MRGLVSEPKAPRSPMSATGGDRRKASRSFSSGRYRPIAVTDFVEPLPPLMLLLLRVMPPLTSLRRQRMLRCSQFLGEHLHALRVVSRQEPCRMPTIKPSRVHPRWGRPPTRLRTASMVAARWKSRSRGRDSMTKKTMASLNRALA